MRSSGSSTSPLRRADDREVGHEGGVRAQLEHDIEVADVVVVVVGEEDPAHVGGVDDREGLLEPGVADERASRCRR